MFKKSIKIFVFIFSAVIFFTACEKDNLSNVTENQDNDNTEQRILEFKTKVESKSKSGDEITVQDAVWLVEALSNYKYCMITEEKQQADLNAIAVDSIFIEVETTDNFMTVAEAVNAFVTLEETIISTFSKFDYDIKFYDLVDVEFIDSKFRVYYTFAYNLDCGSKIDCYSVNQNWYFGMDLGKCDGTCVGKDATNVLYRQINYNVAYPYNQYFTDIDYIWERADYSAFATQNNPYGDYLMFIVDIPDYQTYSCIPANAMNYYVTGTHQALNILQDEIPQGYRFKSWRLHYLHGGSEQFGFHNGHSCQVWYGVVHNIPPAN